MWGLRGGWGDDQNELVEDVNDKGLQSRRVEILKLNDPRQVSPL